MLYKKGFPAIYLNMLERKEDILKDNWNKAGIYLITNKINKKHYVGKSSNIGKRFQNYFSEGFLILNYDNKFCNALSKIGYKNFSVTILEYSQDETTLSSRELFYINVFKPLYNIRGRTLENNNEKPLVNKTENKDSDSIALEQFKKLYRNRIIPTKVSDLIRLAEISENQDFIMQINQHKKNCFIFFFVDEKNEKFFYANSAL